LRGVPIHVEVGQEHFVGVLCVLDVEELVTAVKPWQQVVGVGVGGEQELVATTSSIGDRVTVGRALLVVGHDLLRLDAVDDDGQLALVTLDRGEGGCHVVDHCT
jgi:hypothetical protein